MVLCIYYVHRALDGRYFKWLPGARVKCWMRLTLYKLTQLAVSAKILCLLMVLSHNICGASVQSKIGLFNQASQGCVWVYHNGTVMAKRDGGMQKLQLLSSDRGSLNSDLFDAKIVIYEPTQRMFICFNNNRKWKLVGKRISLERAKHMKLCQFHETINDSIYFTYSSVVNQKHFLSFNSRGVPTHRGLSGPKKNMKFMKIREMNPIDDHNSKVADMPQSSTIKTSSQQRSNNEYRKDASRRHRHYKKYRDTDKT